MRKATRSGTFQPKPQAASSRAERRRSQRISMAERVAVSWHTLDGTSVTERCKTEVVSAHGALLRMRRALPMRQVIQLTRIHSHDWSLARVMDSTSEEPDGTTLVALELAVPSKTFWQVGSTQVV